jgi:2-methylcitrate dehydratase PrpD
VTVLGTPYRAPVALAGLANGCSGHSVDFDDDNAQVHVGATVVPAALAVAEHVGATGEALLKAVLAGYEASIRVGWFVRPENLTDRGFHPTGVCNSFGAAAAASVLLGLDGEQMAMAFGIAGTMAGGLLEFYTDGAMTKRLNAGHAAQAGINAALIAAAGGTGPATILEGRWGVATAFAGASTPDAITDGLGEKFLIMDTAQKYYPMNFAIHSSIDATLELMRESALTVDDVARVVARVRPNNADQFNTSAAYELPTVLSAQMSVPFGVAVAMINGTVTLDQIDPSWTTRDDVREVARRVVVEADPELEHVDGVDIGTVLPVDLTLTTTSGQELHRRIIFQRGDPRNPLSTDDLETKFRTCAGTVLADAEVAQLHDHLSNLESLRSVTGLAALLAVG